MYEYDSEECGTEADDELPEVSYKRMTMLIEVKL